MPDTLSIQNIINAADEPISAHEIGAITGLADAEVRRCIAIMRKNGIPVCSCRWGYYFGDRTNVIKTIAALERRIENQKMAVNGLKIFIMNNGGYNDD